MRQCDLCFAWDPETSFPAMPVRHHFVSDDSARIDTRGPWLVCRRCTFLVLRGQWSDLTQRVVNAILEADPSFGSLRGVLTEEVSAFLQAFDNARMGAPRSVTAGQLA